MHLIHIVQRFFGIYMQISKKEKYECTQFCVHLSLMSVPMSVFVSFFIYLFPCYFNLRKFESKT